MTAGRTDPPASLRVPPSRHLPLPPPQLLKAPAVPLLAARPKSRNRASSLQGSEDPKFRYLYDNGDDGSDSGGTVQQLDPPDNGSLRARGLVLIENGYEPTPVVGKAALSDGWQNGDITPERFIADLANQLNATGIGLRTGALQTIDIDLEDNEHAETIREVIKDTLGYHSPLSRIGRKGVMLLYRGTNPTASKITIKGRAPDGNKVETLVEFQAKGQQIVAYGIHPDTRRRYEWEGEMWKAEPRYMPFSDLPELMPEQRIAVAQAVVKKLQDLGYVDVKILGLPGDDAKISEQSSRPVSIEQVRNMLGHIDPGGVRDDWITTLAALHHAFSNGLVINHDTYAALTPDDGLTLADAWSRGSLGNRSEPNNYKGRDDVERNWDGFDGARERPATIGTVIKKACDGGYEGATSHINPDDLFGPSTELTFNDLAPVKPFPVEILPNVMQDFVSDQAELLQVPEDMIAQPLLSATLPTAIGPRFQFQPKARDTGWREYASFWGGLVGDPGISKTPAMKKALEPLREIERNEVEDHKRAMAEYEPREASAKRYLRQWEKDCAEAIKDSKPQPEKPKEAQIEEPPTWPQLIVGDITQEKLVEVMGGNPSLLMHRDELVGFFRSINQYRSKGAGADRQFYLSTYSNDPLRHQRKSGDDISIPRPFLNIFGGIQPDKLTDALGGADSDDDGMAARFSALVWPDTLADWKHIDREPDLKAKVDTFDIVKKLRTLDPADVQPENGWLQFDADAQCVFDEWYASHQKRLRLPLLSSRMKNHLSKSSGLFARVAMVLHLTRHVAGETKDPARADKKTAESVVAYLEYLESHAKRIYGFLDRDNKRGPAEKVINWIRASQPQSFTVRDIKRKNWTGLQKDEAVEDVLALLIENNILAKQENTGSPNGGRPTTRYFVNPRFLEPAGANGGRAVT